MESTVKDVLPAVESNKEKVSLTLSLSPSDHSFVILQMAQVVENLKEKVVTKGKEIGEYMEKHNIQIRQESSQQSDDSTKEGNESKSAAKSASGVLVQD